jgi:hypothetical protein
MAEELGDVLWYVANLAEKLDLKLDEVAQRNLRKVRDRWPQHGETLPLAIGDERFPESERLPRRTSVRFVESEQDVEISEEARSWRYNFTRKRPLGRVSSTSRSPCRLHTSPS